LEAKKKAFAAAFVQRAQFTLLYPTTQTPAQLVDALFAHTGIAPTNERQMAIDEIVSEARP
jgi:hypothetical protein